MITQARTETELNLTAKLTPPPAHRGYTKARLVHTSNINHADIIITYMLRNAGNVILSVEVSKQS